MTYEVLSVRHGAAGSGILHLTLDKALPANSRVAVSAGSNVFAIADATVGGNAATGTGYFWTNVDRPWTVGTALRFTVTKY